MNDNSKTDIQTTDGQTAITKLEAKRVELQALADKYADIRIVGINDKDGIEYADNARKELKTVRCALKNEAEAVRAPAIDFQKKVVTIEKELTKIVADREEAIEKELERIAAERRKILEEEAARQRAELNRRVGELAKVGYGHDIEALRVMEDLDFEILLAEKTEDFESAMERKQEADRATISAAFANAPNASVSRVPVGTVSFSQESEPTKEPIMEAAIAKAKDSSDAFTQWCSDRGITKKDIESGEIFLKKGEASVTAYRKMAVFVNPA